MEKKKCSICGSIKEYSKFYNQSGSTDGKRRVCKKCYERNKRKRTAELHEQGLRRCIKCRCLKSIDEFGKSKHTYDGYMSACLACSDPNRKEWEIPTMWELAREQAIKEIEDGMELKNCGKCGEGLPLKHFYESHREADGMFPTCEFCMRNLKTHRQRDIYDQTKINEKYYAHYFRSELI